MMRAAKKPKLQVERFIQPSSTPAVKLIWEYVFSNGRTTLQTGHVSLGEAALESEQDGSLCEPHTVQDWPDYNDWDKVSPFCDSPIITGDVLQDKRKEYAADNLLLVWLLDHQFFLDETIFLEGRGHKGQRTVCRCGSEIEEPKYRCRDCFGMEMYCQHCTVECHQSSPLHVIEEWNGSFFQCTHLKSLGLCVQLGHPPSDHCYNPRPSTGNDFIVVDINGIHDVALDFCGSTTTDPQTAATFNVLEHYQLLSFESKISAYEFYHSLARHSDNTGLSSIKDHYSAFMRIVHEWRHLQQLRCSGRGHDPGGVAETKAGELVVVCPACPHAGKNLPQGWGNSPPATRWLYALFVAIDANFHLKRKAVSSDRVDPGLNTGWAYFVEEHAYKSYLSERTNEQQERSTCVSHNAVNMADTKSSQGLAATGIGTINCARHEFKLPNGVGDLQKGERYLNMDYIVFSALVGFTVTMLNISYNIACQWSKNLWNRMEHMPARLHIPHDDVLVRYFIPKFHIAAHIAACQLTFSWNFTKWVGRTDGEAPERGWASANRVTSSTKEMGPGTRRDTLDNHFGDWNWKKTTTLDSQGHTLKRKMENTIKWEWEHRVALYDLEGTIQPALLDEWGTEVEMWEEDNTRPNPFKSKLAPITQATVRSQLAELEAQELREGINHSLDNNVSPSVLISGGIELEDLQYNPSRNNLSLHPTENQREAIIHRTNALKRRINSWTHYQQLYMPIVSTLRSSTNPSPGSPQTLKLQDFPLYLPSALLNHLDCNHRLMKHEWKLRQAQAHDALNELCSHLCLYKNLRGQAASTHAQNLIAHVEAKKDAAVARYRCTRQAIESLSCWLDEMGWEATLRPLRHEDIQPMGDFTGDRTQGTRTISWIWLMTDVDTSPSENESVQDCVRIEWCKARALLAFLEWQGSWWHQHTMLRSSEKTTEQEGLQAYAYRQAALHSAMRTSFQACWSFDDSGPSIDAPPAVMEF
ncbi:uncharacterized protein EDB93DRAFT_1241867 [Suillus bovinus]|uniref:uncharacterized protein n=1 Tax=Suillus bovinus TaxID=48563 RepID=UPI001B86998B|nr:uncharacterized protein EDB93DRAFT_1241867 [Suillus bovinus]KAG2140526.1 hypothetical protein EDB93DRAFT_1241867 [Suillus bovinus]